MPPVPKITPLGKLLSTLRVVDIYKIHVLKWWKCTDLGGNKSFKSLETAGTIMV